MSNKNRLIIKSYEGSCLTSTLNFLFMPLLALTWIGISNIILEHTSIIRRDLFQGLLNSWSILFYIAIGFILHESSQYFAHRLFGGKPFYGNRRYKENRTPLERRYLFPITIRFWSPNKKFSIYQYLLVVVSPAILNFLFLPLILFAGQVPKIFSAIWLIGFSNSFFIAMDLLVAGIIIKSAEKGYYIEDKLDGTYLVKNKSISEIDL